MILVKNLETQTTVSELRDLFTPFGEVGRVLLPPNGVTAIVEFLEPSEAKVAFRKLAYSKFHHIPLYLEWAPINTFRKSSNTKSNQGIMNDIFNFNEIHSILPLTKQKQKTQRHLKMEATVFESILLQILLQTHQKVMNPNRTLRCL